MTITLRRESHPKGCYDTEFSYEDYKETFTLSDADLDSGAGDLEEWCVVKYSKIPAVIKLLNSKYGSFTGTYTENQKKFFDDIKNKEVKDSFPYILNYCENHNGSMLSFEKLLDENNIDYSHSAYRSGSWD